MIQKLHLLIASAISVNAGTASMRTEAKGPPLELFEAFARAYGDDPNFRIDDAFRHEDGTLKTPTYYHAQPIANNGRTLLQSTDDWSCEVSSQTLQVDDFPEMEYQLRPPSTPTLAERQTSFCMRISSKLSKNEMNWNGVVGQNAAASRENLSIQGLSGITCENCFSYMGADITYFLECTLSTASQSCTYGQSVGGGTAYRIDLQAENPRLDGTVNFNVHKGSETELFRDPKTGFTIKATPNLDLKFSGNIGLQGIGSIKAAFGTSSDMSLGINNFDISNVRSTSFNLDTNINANVEKIVPIIEHGFYFDTSPQDIKLAVTIIPSAEWNIGFNQDLSGISVDVFTKSTTTLEAYFELEQNGESECGNSFQLNAGASFDAIGATAKGSVMARDFTILEEEYPFSNVKKEKNIVSSEDSSFTRGSDEPFCLSTWGTSAPPEKLGTGGDINAAMTKDSSARSGYGPPPGPILFIIFGVIGLIATLIIWYGRKTPCLKNWGEKSDAGASSMNEMKQREGAASASSV